MEYTYKCEDCGACCRFGNTARFDPSMVDEHGNCKNLDMETKLCKDYENRPDFCNVNKWYEVNFKDKGVSYEDYIKDQREGCDVMRKLREKENEILFKRTSVK
jgi:Fe-S-cluster containining protein